MFHAFTGSRLGAVGIVLALTGTTLFGLGAERLVLRDKTPLTAANPDSASATGAREVYGRLPLSFEPNVGQTDAHVDFLARGSGYTLFLTPNEAVLSLGAAALDSSGRPSKAQPQGAATLRMGLVGGSAAAQVGALQALPGKVNYFVGNDPAAWRTNIPTYGKISYRDVYPGIDLVYYGNQGRLEYDFVVKPGADPAAIALGYEGAETLELDARGDLVLRLGPREIRQAKPILYQQINGERRQVSGAYLLSGSGTVRLEIGDYDNTAPLVIDPTLIYSTYLGGSGGDFGLGIAVDPAGSAYVTGFTYSTNFPTTTGILQTANTGGDDVFVTKLNATGSAIVYSTYLGGSGDDLALGIAVDSAGSAYIVGRENSANFPTTTGAFQTSFGGLTDAFVTKLNATGSALVYSTYLGGSSQDYGFGIALDSTSSAYVTGSTESTNFPTTTGAFQTTGGASNGDAFVTKLNATGSALMYSTYLGGNNDDRGFGIAVDSAGSVYVTGPTISGNFPTTTGAFQTSPGGDYDAFVTKLNATGTAPLVYSTYLRGSGDDQGYGIAVDSAGRAYVTGYTTSTNFPTTTGAFQPSSGGFRDIFVTKLNSTGTAPLVYSTYLGGTGDDRGLGIAVDSAGSAYVTGQTDSPNFPTATGAFQTSSGGGVDVFVTKLNATGSAPLVYSTYLGGSGLDIGAGVAVDSAGSSYVTGYSESTNFPTTIGAFQTSSGGNFDAFVTKLDTSGAPATLTLSPLTAVNSVGTSHTVTATATNSAGQPVQNVTIVFTVAGSVTTSGSCTTGSNGQCSFTYQGPSLPGGDVITGCADTNNSGTIETTEPCAEALKAWILPASTPGQVTGGGWIIDPVDNERVSFGFNAQSSNGVLKGNCTVMNAAPVVNIKIKCLDVTALVQNGTHATFFGNAEVNGVSTTYRIDVDDLAEPGRDRDTFTIQTASGFRASGILDGGNIQVHRAG